MLAYFYEFIDNGGYIMIPLYITGPVGWIYIITMLFYTRTQYKYMSKNVVRHLENTLKESNTTKPSSNDKLIPSILYILKSNRNKSEDEIYNLVNNELSKEFYSKYRKVGTIKTLAQIAPLLGLLGTVSGMILTFKTISYYGNTNPTLMADGISEALLTTQAGLITAFPLMLMFIVVKNRLDNIKFYIKTLYKAFLRINYETK